MAKSFTFQLIPSVSKFDRLALTNPDLSAHCLSIKNLLEDIEASESNIGLFCTYKTKNSRLIFFSAFFAILGMALVATAIVIQKFQYQFELDTLTYNLQVYILPILCGFAYELLLFTITFCIQTCSYEKNLLQILFNLDASLNKYCQGFNSENIKNGIKAEYKVKIQQGSFKSKTEVVFNREQDSVPQIVITLLNLEIYYQLKGQFQPTENKSQYYSDHQQQQQQQNGQYKNVEYGVNNIQIEMANVGEDDTFENKNLNQIHQLPNKKIRG